MNQKQTRNQKKNTILRFNQKPKTKSSLANGGNQSTSWKHTQRAWTAKQLQKGLLSNPGVESGIHWENLSLTLMSHWISPLRYTHIWKLLSLLLLFCWSIWQKAWSYKDKCTCIKLMWPLVPYRQFSRKLISSLNKSKQSLNKVTKHKTFKLTKSKIISILIK